METVDIFSAKFTDILGQSVKNVLLETSEINVLDSPKNTQDWHPQKENSLSCSYCRVDFDHAQQQREHYKLDWHRYNLKQSLLTKNPVTEDEFVKATENDDLSSISGSDSEKDDNLDTYAVAQGKIFLQNDKIKVFSMYRCLLLDRKEDITDTDIFSKLKLCCVDNKQWAILMLGGGHFAGAVFQGHEPILHKTFHCYTVRAGQGGSQSSRDNKSGGSHPKSAGASLRRYNEQALIQHVRSILEIWKPEILKCSLIMYRASGPFNRAVLFGGNPPLLERSDKRLRTIPFSTRRATFTEVKRVHSLLTQATVYSSLSSATETFAKQMSPEKDSKRNKIRSNCINRAKSREAVERPLPAKLSSASSSVADLAQLDIDDIQLDSNDVEISFEDLQEFDDSLTPEQRKKQQKKKKPRKSKTKKLREQEEARKKGLADMAVKGDLITLKNKLENHFKSTCGEDGCEIIDANAIKDAFINEVLDETSNTLLHIAAMNEHDELVKYLLENEANPCLKNKQQETAYTCTKNKDVRDILKQFAKEHPEKYNYNKAHIPINALTDEEIAERKKAQRKIKKEKEKEKKKVNDIKKKEEEEKLRFLNLSDREKRALAAERRILNTSGVVNSRCFFCGLDIAGKVPFEYSGNRFCSMDCLKAHRLKNPPQLS